MPAFDPEDKKWLSETIKETVSKALQREFEHLGLISTDAKERQEIFKDFLFIRAQRKLAEETGKRIRWIALGVIVPGLLIAIMWGIQRALK